MFKKIKTSLAAVAMVFAIGAPVLVPVAVYAQSDSITPGLCAGSNLNTDNTQSCTVDTAGANSKINSILKTVINLFSLIVGVVAVIMIIVGGLRYITSGGESSNVSTAKNTIIYAIVGLVIVALAQFIVHYVLGKVTGTTS
jgi:cytochrome bd-type quinol oxidase subunit 2